MDPDEDELAAAVMKQIRVEMLERDMLQKDLSDAAGMERATLNRYLMGHRSLPLPVFLRLAKALGIKPAELLGRAEARLPSLQAE